MLHKQGQKENKKVKSSWLRVLMFPSLYSIYSALLEKSIKEVQPDSAVKTQKLNANTNNDVAVN